MNGLAVIDRALACHERLKALLILRTREILHAGVASGVPLLAKRSRLPSCAGESRRRCLRRLLMLTWVRSGLGLAVPG